MTGNVFNKWFSEILDILEPTSVIVFNNALYYSVKLEKIPTSSSNKAAIKKWLDSKGIPYKEDELKKEFLAKVYEVCWQYNRYVIDTTTERKGFHNIETLSLSLQAQPY